MCGIIGYTGNKNAWVPVLEGLKKLEYRGYDSAGIAGSTVNENEMIITRAEGKILNLEEKITKVSSTFSSAIGHTRWATHGKPSEANAHPHKSGKVTIVHNGIIENYMELKEFLTKEGYTFNSETDTEVACAYINYMYEKIGNKEETIFKACKEFRGSYAFGIFFDNDDTIYSIRLNSPLVIGISDDGNFIGSDISAFLEYTKEYILLDNNQKDVPTQLAIVTKDSVVIKDENLNEVSYTVETATWDAAALKKDGYDHFMRKEISEQPKVLAKLFADYLENKDTYFKDINLTNFNSIHIVACGSSMHAGLVGKYLLKEYAKFPTQIEIASEYRYSEQLLTDDTLVIFMSQSGETADTLAALKLAKEKGAKTLAIVNVIGSTIAREADYVLYTHAGPEIAVATTKGYTSQVAVMVLLAFELAKKHLSAEKQEKIFAEFANIETLINEALEKEEQCSTIAKKICDTNRLFFIGRAIDYDIGAEGSLKFKEISYIPSENYAAGELKHGTLALIEDNTPIVAISTVEKLYEKVISNIKETKARGAFTIFVTNDELSETDFADEKVLLTGTSDFTSTFGVSVVLQLLAYHTAKHNGCDIDQPKNLAKSVTVE